MALFDSHPVVKVAAIAGAFLAVTWQLAVNQGVPVPTAIADKHTPEWTSSKITIGSTEYATTSKTLIRTGEEWRASHPYEGDTYGKVLAKDRTPVPECIGEDDYYGCPKTSTTGDSTLYSPYIDFTSIMRASSGNTLYAVTHMEAPLPASTYLLTIEQNKANGDMQVTKSEYIDWSEFEGLWVPCAGTVSPWGSHLGGEEYEARADDWESLQSSDSPSKDQLSDAWMATLSPDPIAFGRYWGIAVDDPEWGTKIKEKFNPWNYGWPFEVQIDASTGSYSVFKHFALGRRSNELLYVMPDRKTVYITDDGTNGHLSMFVADAENDLSAGTLYCAKITTRHAETAASAEFDVEWVNLGHATAAEIKADIDNKLLFSDIFEKQSHPCGSCSDGKENCTCTQACPGGFRSVNAMYAHAECLQVKPGKEKAASRLESRRYCAYMGGTTEFRKMEGFSFDADSNKAYLGISQATRGMADGYSQKRDRNTYDVGGPNHIQIKEENDCGCVFEMPVDSSNMRITSMKSLVCGQEIEPDANGNTCHLDSIAYPDNVAVVHGHNGLLIGEDGKGHENNMMWFFDFAQNSLTRIMHGVLGSEICTPYFYPDLNGWSYFFGSVQHPYRENGKWEERLSEHATGVGGWLTYMSWQKVEGKSYPVPTVWGNAEYGDEDKASIPHAISVALILAMLPLLNMS